MKKSIYKFATLNVLFVETVVTLGFRGKKVLQRVVSCRFVVTLT